MVRCRPLSVVSTLLGCAAPQLVKAMGCAGAYRIVSGIAHPISFTSCSCHAHGLEKAKFDIGSAKKEIKMAGCNKTKQDVEAYRMEAVGLGKQASNFVQVLEIFLRPD